MIFYHGDTKAGEKPLLENSVTRVSVVQLGRICRILAVDHGEKRIGLALSDPTATIASPLQVIKHVSRLLDAAQVANIASENEVGLIVIGQSFDEEGNPNLAGRRAAKFAEALKEQTNIPVELFDESFHTRRTCHAYRNGSLAQETLRSHGRTRGGDDIEIVYLK